MKIDVNTSIYELLYEKDEVNIPGLGGFSAHYKPAVVDQIQGQLHPPAKELQFNGNLVVDDGFLVQYIQEKYQVSPVDAQTAIREYVRGVKAALERQEIVAFPRLGRLYLDYEHTYKFLPDTTNFNTDSFGLPKVEAYPIAHNNKPNYTQATPVSETPSWRKRLEDIHLGNWVQNNLIWLTTGAFLLLLAIVYFGFLRNDDPVTPPVAGIPDERVNISPSMSTTEEEEDAALLDTNNEETVIEAEPESEEENLDTEGPTRLPDEKFCIISIGSFGNEDNVRKLVEKIYKEGYEPYTEKKGRLTMVGVQMRYNNESDIKNALSTIRKKFEAGAKVVKK
ncbi:MAG: hypothetical protein DHS20C18_27670 [Saprospiraceae bacterium]|nr:MAG: hypothetical protein DHS20C18_27670 [Saprospiraceae bacterium]